MPFKPNKRFKKDYDKLFHEDPIGANLFLLLAELANEKGQVKLGPKPDEELSELMVARFQDPEEYQL